MHRDPFNPWVLIEFCDWVASNGTQSAPREKLSSWGLEGSNGTYTGSHPCPMGTTVVLTLGTDRGGNSYLSGACAKLVREGQMEDIVRVDWRSWANRQKDRTPHVHLQGNRVYIDTECGWQDVRHRVIETMEKELDLEYDEAGGDDQS